MRLLFLLPPLMLGLSWRGLLRVLDGAGRGQKTSLAGPFEGGRQRADENSYGGSYSRENTAGVRKGPIVLPGPVISMIVVIVKK